MSRSTLVAGLSLAALTTLAAPSPAQKTPDVRLDTDPPGATGSYDPVIAASGGSVYTLFNDSGRTGGGGGLLLSRSQNDGFSWSNTEIPMGAPPSSGVVTTSLIASGDNVIALWETYPTNSNVWANRSLDGGATWLSAPVRVNDPVAGNRLYSDLAFADTVTFATWQDDRNSVFPNTTWDIYFARSTTGGGHWQFNRRVNTSNPPANATRPQMAVSGIWGYIAWEDERHAPGASPGRRDIYFSRSFDAGVNWLQVDKRLNTNTPGSSDSERPTIAATDDAVYVTWADERNATGVGDIYFNRSLDNGSTWLATDIRLDADFGGVMGDSRGAVVAAYGTAVYVAWADAVPGAPLARNVYFNRSLDRGATWLPAPIRINSVTGVYCGEPQIVVSDSAVGVTWRDARNSTSPIITDLYFDRSLDRGLTWLDDDIRLNTGAAPGSADIKVHSTTADADSIHVAWADLRNGSPDVFFNLPYGAQRYGRGKLGSGGLIPTLKGTGPTVIGKTFRIDAGNAPAGGSAALLVGAAATEIPILGGFLLVSPPILSVPIALDGTGSASLPLTVPNDDQFVGLPIFFQLFPLDPGASGGLSMSNGVQVWIG